MKEKLKAIGGGALAILFMVIGITVLVFFITGGVWLSERLLPTMSVATGWAFVACLFVLVPLAVFHPTRGCAGVGLLIASYIFGLMLWMTGLLLTYSIWGFIGVFAGLFMLGVGVVFTAILAAIFNGLWSSLFLLIFLGFLTYGSRLMSLYVIEKYEQQQSAGNLEV